MNQFAKSLRASCNKVLAEVDQACYSVFYELATNTVSFTPVDKGLLINQWYAKAGEDPSNELGTNTDISGMNSYSSISSLYNAKEFYKKDGAMTLTNNVDYGYLADIQGWLPPQWSGQVGPYRMRERAIQLTVEKFNV